jgi:hypothetical protein
VNFDGLAYVASNCGAGQKMSAVVTTASRVNPDFLDPWSDNPGSVVPLPGPPAPGASPGGIENWLNSKGQSGKTRKECIGTAFHNHEGALAIDVAGGVASFSGLGTVGGIFATLALSTAGAINSGVTHDLLTGGNLAGGVYVSGVLNAASDAGKWGIARWMPGIGWGIAAFTLARDIAMTYLDYQSCMVGN